MRITTAVLATLLLASAASAAGTKRVVLEDPTGDDKGPGKYEYPSDPVYRPGSFDLQRIQITDKGQEIEIRVRLGARIDDPWNSSSWGGNGFSLQLVQLYINTKRGGFLGALPGMNVKFQRGHAWDKVVFISPQSKAKIVAEVRTKAGKKLRGLVVPKQVSVRGRELVAVVAKAALGTPSDSWGYQALVQSNEGYPAGNSVLARKVNEYRGQHRFGGGNDHDCDPHVLDILAGKARGGADERAAQYKILGAYRCTPSGQGTKAVLPMIYPAKRD